MTFQTKKLLDEVLKLNVGHITSYPVPDEEGCIQYPVTVTFCGKNGNSQTSITGVYLDESGEPCIDGLNKKTSVSQYEVKVQLEHCSMALGFISYTLGFQHNRKVY